LPCHDFERGDLSRWDRPLPFEGGTTSIQDIGQGHALRASTSSEPAYAFLWAKTASVTTVTLTCTLDLYADRLPPGDSAHLLELAARVSSSISKSTTIERPR
jgi:hypothetical protein